jgi:hypothetical protein
MENWNLHGVLPDLPEGLSEVECHLVPGSLAGEVLTHYDATYDPAAVSLEQRKVELPQLNVRLGGPC